VSFLSLGLVLTLTSCGKYNFEEIYRYPCQDPANFGSPECEPPACEAWGGCTKDILPGLNLDGEVSE
jgi:hypothetical protein